MGKVVHGRVNFHQDDKNSPVHVTGTLHGHSPGLYGFHVHADGDITTADCMGTGPHFNPKKVSLNDLGFNLLLHDWIHFVTFFR